MVRKARTEKAGNLVVKTLGAFLDRNLEICAWPQRQNGRALSRTWFGALALDVVH